MADVTAASFDEMEPIFDGAARRARATLGVSAFGMQLLTLPPHWEGYPNHKHDAGSIDPNQEEVYIPLQGSATLEADGERIDLRPGRMVRVGPSSSDRSSPAGRCPADRTRRRSERKREAGELVRPHRELDRAAERRVMRHFQDAWDAVDIERLVALLADDALMTMPPESMRVAGAAEIAGFFGTVPLDGRLDRVPLMHARANGQPAFAAYTRDEEAGNDRGYGFMVFAIEGNLIVGITGFPFREDLFARHGLPLEMRG